MDESLYVYECFRGSPISYMDQIREKRRRGEVLVGIEELEHAISCDDKDTFVRLINRYPCSNDVPKEMLDWMFGYDAVQCAAAVLARETSPNFSFGYGLTSYNERQVPLLHKAAMFGATKLTKLFLERCADAAGANCTLESDGLFNPDVKGKMMLPLDMAYHLLRYNLFLYDWNPATGSVIRIIYGLCCPHMRKFLENVRLLVMWRNELEKEFLNLVKEGRVVEVAALLLIGHQKLSPKFLNDPNGRVNMINIRKSLVQEIASLGVHRVIQRHSEDPYELRQDRDFETKILEMEAILQVIEIFEKIGSSLAAFLKLNNGLDEEAAVELIWIFENAGMDVRSEILSGLGRHTDPNHNILDLPPARWGETIWSGLAQERKNGIDQTNRNGRIDRPSESLNKWLLNLKSVRGLAEVPKKPSFEAQNVLKLSRDPRLDIQTKKNVSQMKFDIQMKKKVNQVGQQQKRWISSIMAVLRRGIGRL